MLIDIVQTLLLIPVAGGTVFCLATLITALLFMRRGRSDSKAKALLPRVSILKPVYGLERNLRSACTQDYPDYQVVFSVQRLDDPALPLLRQLEQD